MSKKSRQPEEPKGKKGKGKKGKKGQAAAGQRQLVVESAPAGVPFAVVVLLAAVMTLPSVSNYAGGGLAFDALMLRAIAALAVSWLLSQLVYAVFETMRPPEVTAIVEVPPEEAFDALSRRGPLTGTIVEDDYVAGDEPFALSPVDPIEPGPVPESGARGEPAA